VKTLLENQEKQKAQTETVLELSRRMMTMMRGKTFEVSQRPDYKLPMNLMSEFEALELKLEKKDTCSELVSFLTTIGGKDYKDTLTRAFEAVMSNTLATKFCWQGIRKENPKIAFKDTKLKMILFDVVRKNPFSVNATDSELKSKAASWLQHATDRANKEKVPVSTLTSQAGAAVVNNGDGD